MQALLLYPKDCDAFSIASKEAMPPSARAMVQSFSHLRHPVLALLLSPVLSPAASSDQTH